MNMHQNFDTSDNETREAEVAEEMTINMNDFEKQCAADDRALYGLLRRLKEGELVDWNMQKTAERLIDAFDLKAGA